MPFAVKYLNCAIFFAVTSTVQASEPAVQKFELDSLSLIELMKIKVTTASKREQSQQESPAFVEIVTQRELQNRGYKDLSYLLDDLVGVQVSRSFGDNTFNLVWRGTRHTIGSSHLVLVDGVRFNHLYNNEAEVLAAMPMSNIKQIEIVYGPASVAYGSDAVVGIINIITEKSQQKTAGFVQFGDNQQRVFDASWRSHFDDYTLSMTARIDNGDIDFSNAGKYRWTDPSLLSNQDIWGEFTQAYGDLSSPHENRGFDLRLSRSNHEFAAQYYRMAGGYGLEYTFDHSLPDAGLWSESDYSFHWRSEFKINEAIGLKTFLRYRQSNIDDNSFFIEGYLVNDPDTGNPIRLVDTSYWESENSSISGRIESDWRINSNWNLLSGLEFENKNLQKAYNINFGPALPPSQIDLQTYPFPEPPNVDTVNKNHIKTRQQSAYALAEYRLPSKDESMNHNFHFGVRFDQHSKYDGETSVRTGYVNHWSQYTFKLFYGEAFQEPPARLLYGGWQGSGSDPDLNPRTAKTWEFNFSYQMNNALISTNLYRMQSRNLFNTTDFGAVNAGKGTADGGDLRFQYRNKTQSLNRYSFWAAVSWVDSREQAFNENGELEWLNSGDQADTTFHFGSDYTFNENWKIHLRGRYYGERRTVETNPLGNIDSFTTADINLTYSPDFLQNVKFALALTNITDEIYFHPGLRSASASISNVGQVNADGVWIGSESFYNAQIPQPGRQTQLTIYWDL